MLTIRLPQMQSLAGAAQRSFTRELARDVGRIQTTARLPPEQAIQLVESTLARARAYSLEGPRALRTFVFACLEFGWDFDSRHPWVPSALTDRTLGDPAARVQWVFHELRRRKRIQAANQARREAFLA